MAALSGATGRVAIRRRMVLSLTFDHRLIDGVQAAKFLQRVKKLIETPYLWLAGWYPQKADWQTPVRGIGTSSTLRKP